MTTLLQNATNAAALQGAVHPGRPEAIGTYASPVATKRSMPELPCVGWIGFGRGLDSNREASVG